jgi:chemotaxis protein methyltransferase CheR
MNETPLFEELAKLATQQIGLRIPDDAHDRFVATLSERAAHLGYASLEGYQTFLAGQQATEEWEILARSFTCGETFFFRDHGQIDLLRLHLLPELIAQHHNDKTLRLWSAGCASGEEAYSLAMLVDMLLPSRDGWNILILGSDIDSEAIARAQQGRYGQWSFRLVPEILQQRYFHRQGQVWVLDQNIRRMVTLSVSNLVVDPFPDSSSELHSMDLILCRNVFIYFNSPVVYAVAAKFSATLCEGGYLLTAHTELIGHAVRELESRMFAEGVVYQRISCQDRAIQPVRPPAPGLAPLAWQARLVMPPSVNIAGKLQPAAIQATPATDPAPAKVTSIEDVIFKEARAHADRGEFDLAGLTCHKALGVNALAAAPHFLLAQLAQVKGDFNLAKECLNKAIYLDSRFVAAYLELAALCERADDMPRALTLRRAALGIVRNVPHNQMIDQCEMSAGALTQWLVQWAGEGTEGTSKSEPSKLKS